ncbi:MAG: HAMP domain-containing protein [Candidatus Avelusimicrobium sp.]
MAGPVYHFERVCKAIAKGDYSQRVHLRKGDQLTDLQEEFNKMMDRIEAEINKNKPS